MVNINKADKEDLEQAIKNKFKHLSNAQLIAKANRAPNFGWDDEGYEIERRIKASNGRFNAIMDYYTLIIIKDDIL